MIAGIGNNQGSLLRTYSKGTDMPMPMGGTLGANPSGPRILNPPKTGVGKPDYSAKKAKQAGQRKAMMGSLG